MTIPIALDRRACGPLHEQIAGQVGAAVDQGRLARGVRLPSTRTLASALGVTRGVTNAAYSELLARGYLEPRRGSGTYIASAGTPVSDLTRPPARRAPTRIDLVPRPHAPETFPRAAWFPAWREAALAGPGPERAPLGLPMLRAAVAEHLSHTMGPLPAGHTVVITSSTAAAVRQILAVLDLAPDEVAVEDPSPVTLPGSPLPVDASGPPAGVRAVIVAPDGQVPLARVMPVTRRRELASWGGYVLCIQSSRAPRPDAVPLPDLVRLGAAGRTALIGEVCDEPSLRVGYAIVPAEWAPRLGRLLHDGEAMTPYVTQRAAARLLSDGTVRQLLRRQQQSFEDKRRYVGTRLTGPDGLLLGDPWATGAAPLYLPSDVDADEVVARARSHGLRVRTLASYHRLAAPSGLAIGYGHLPMATLRRGLTILIEALAAVAARGPR